MILPIILLLTLTKTQLLNFTQLQTQVNEEATTITSDGEQGTTN